MDIRKLLETINNFSSPKKTLTESKFGKGVKVISLDQFVKDAAPSEEIDEVSDKVRKSYIPKAAWSAAKLAAQAGSESTAGKATNTFGAALKATKRLAGIEKAVSKLAKNKDAEVTEELGGGFNPRYIAQANKERMRKEREAAKYKKLLLTTEGRVFYSPEKSYFPEFKGLSNEEIKQLADETYFKYKKATKSKGQKHPDVAKLWAIHEKYLKELMGRRGHDPEEDWEDDEPLDEAKKELELDGWIIKDRSRVGGGSDPTRITKWTLKGINDYIEITEMFGDWYIKAERGTFGPFNQRIADQLLYNLHAPDTQEIGEFLERNASYGDAENGPSPRDLDHLLGEATPSTNTDMSGKKCKKCKKGRYEETSIHDDWDGVVHCNKCNHEVQRHPKKVDEAFKLGGASGRDISDEELKGYLDRIIKKEKGKAEKYKLPYVHSSNIKGIVDANGKEYNLEKLAALFTERPTNILKQNEKMKHSDGTSSVFFNIGLPALIGLAFDEEDKKFVVVSTCPGAGNCKIICYAMKGGYIQYAPPSTHMTKVLNFLLNDPAGFKAKLEGEIEAAKTKFAKKGTDVVIRWHDAGDFFSPEYLDLAYSIARKFPDVLFYAYTKIASVAKGAKPDNFVINFSMGAQPKQEKEINFTEIKHSKIVPEELFSDLLKRIPDPEGKPDKKGKMPTILVYKNKQAIDALKKRLAAKYSIDEKSILTYDEMMETPKGKPNQYNVIVKPGDGDISASRRDVLGTYLLEH